MNEPLTLYKFRSLNNFEFVADIILKRRFYAAQFFDLNDLMEGLFQYTPDEKQEYIDEIVKHKRELRICSFSRTYEDILMWAHYADGFKGICFVIRVQKNSSEYVWKSVRYELGTIHVLSQTSGHGDRVAEYLLCRKNRAWEYEKEERALSRNEFIQDGIEITAVLLGQRTTDSMKQSILKLTAGTSIGVWNTKFDTDRNIIVKTDALYVPTSTDHQTSVMQN